MAESHVDFGKAERDLVLGGMVMMLYSDLPIEVKQLCALLFAVVALQQLETAQRRAGFTSAFRQAFG